MFCLDFFFFIADCKSKTFFCFSVTSHCQQKLTEADAELLINELCFVRSCGIEVVGPCFYLLLSFVLITMSTKVGIWDCYLTRSRQTRGRPSCRSQISLLISSLWMLILHPEVCEHKNCWIVCSISELQTYLTFFVVSNKKTSCSSGWQSCKRFCDSLFDWWRCSLAVGLYAQVIGARYNSIFFLFYFAFDLAVCPSQIVRCGADLCYQTVNYINGI